MRLRSFIFVLSFCISTLCYTQTIYEFHYYFGDGEEREYVKAFMMRNDDGTGFIRSEYMDRQTNSRNIAEMQMEEHYGSDDKGNEDTTLLVFEGFDPKMILGTKAYPADIFIFQLSEETGFYEPHSVVSPNDDGTESEGVITEMNFLEGEDLTEELVLQYFTTEDQFYVNLFETEVRSLTTEEQKTKLFLLVVANTEDVSIGKTCAIDKDATHKTFSQVAEFLKIQFVPKIIYGTEFSKLNVDKAVNALRPGPNDIVIFYYSGHGFNQQKDGYLFPYLDLRDKSFQTYGGQYTLNIESIYQKIKAKGARLNLVISDCCNNDPSQTSNISTDIASTRSSSIGWVMDNCTALFMDSRKQSILMTAASKGELSAGNPNDGGIFTFNFRESLEKFMGPFYKNVTWNGLADIAKKQTITKANHTWCRQADNSRKVCVQNPVFKIE